MGRGVERMGGRPKREEYIHIYSYIVMTDSHCMEETNITL